jgi:hypothetical protein
MSYGKNTKQTILLSTVYLLSLFPSLSPAFLRAMLLFKNIIKDDVFHSNSFGKVNTTFARFVIDFLSMQVVV